MIDPTTLMTEFRAAFGAAPRLFHAPGRVNLIGEHTDYNDGFVFPVAIDVGTTVAAAARPDRLLRVRSRNVAAAEPVTIDLDRPGTPRSGRWTDYVEGVAHALEAPPAGSPLAARRLAGADLLLEGDVPPGAGLSSSAALEVSVGLALLGLSGLDPDGIDRAGLALAGQAAEHAWVGTRCGIMDQLIAARGRAGHALLIDCRSLAATPVPLPLGPGTALVVIDSRVKHELASSAYNARRAECEDGARQLGAELGRPVRALRDVTPEELERTIGRLPPPVDRRCRHVVGENARTLAAARALAAGDLATTGRLMGESHRSLRDDYEVSCSELDLLAETASAAPGVIGARMTGGGFGGCTVNLVAREAVPALRARVTEAFVARFGREPGFLVTRAAAGARELPAA